MGLFASRPEEPTEWGGIPSDPLDPSGIDHLPETVEIDAVGLVGGAAVSSVSIPVPLPEPAPEDPVSAPG